MRLTLPVAADVTIGVYDAMGRRVRSILTAAHLSSGSNTWHWDGEDASGHSVPSGIYRVQVRANGQSRTQSVAVVR